MAHPSLLNELWREQSLWSQAANRLKKKIETARWLALLLVVAIAACGTAAATVHTHFDALSRTLAAAAAIGSGLLPMLRPRWSGIALKDWTRARSVSEALKSEVYLWLAHAGPYAHDPTAACLRERTDTLRRDAADLLYQRERLTAQPRDLPAVHDLRSYFAVRVQGQCRDYYTRKSNVITRRITRFRRLEIGLALLGIAIGAIGALVGTALVSWVAVVSTIGTALSVHVATARYEFQRIEFSRTAEELRHIASRADQPEVPEHELGELAVRAESVISIENQGWMAKLAEDPPDHTPPPESPPH